jgi:hypothetical protein
LNERRKEHERRNRAREEDDGSTGRDAFGVAAAREHERERGRAEQSGPRQDVTHAGRDERRRQRQHDPPRERARPQTFDARALRKERVDGGRRGGRQRGEAEQVVTGVVGASERHQLVALVQRVDEPPREFDGEARGDEREQEGERAPHDPAEAQPSLSEADEEDEGE